MTSEYRLERLKLMIAPEERNTLGDSESTPRSPVGMEPERRMDEAGPGMVPPDDAPRGRAVRMIAAVLALAVFTGVVWYAYDWGVNQVGTARLPVILSDPGPIKFRPESPGGLEVPNQNTLVLNEVTPDPDRPQVERLLPPPETPKPLETAEPDLAELPAGTEALPPAAQPAAAPATRVPLPLPALPKEPEAAPKAAIQPPPATPVPAQQPKEASAGTPAPTAAASNPQSAALAPSGAYVVQLAALKARDGTRPAWTRLQKAHPKLLGDREFTIQTVNLGGRGTFYRIQAGFFPDRASANNLCRALKARRQDCLVIQR